MVYFSLSFIIDQSTIAANDGLRFLLAHFSTAEMQTGFPERCCGRGKYGCRHQHIFLFLLSLKEQFLSRWDWLSQGAPCIADKGTVKRFLHYISDYSKASFPTDAYKKPNAREVKAIQSLFSEFIHLVPDQQRCFKTPKPHLCELNDFLNAKERFASIFWNIPCLCWRR